jgi:hypothetical protein
MKSDFLHVLAHAVMPLAAGAAFAGFCQQSHALDGIYRHLYVHESLNTLWWAVMPLALAGLWLRMKAGSAFHLAGLALMLGPALLCAVGSFVLDGQVGLFCRQDWFNEMPCLRGLAVSACTSAAIAVSRAMTLRTRKALPLIKPARQTIFTVDVAAVFALAFFLQVQFLKWCILEHDPLS